MSSRLFRWRRWVTVFLALSIFIIWSTIQLDLRKLLLESRRPCGSECSPFQHEQNLNRNNNISQKGTLNTSMADSLNIPKDVKVDNRHQNRDFAQNKSLFQPTVYTNGQARATPSTTNVSSTKSKSGFYMTATGNGRLGNELFRYASLLGIATMNGYTPYVEPNSFITKIFKATFVSSRQARGKRLSEKKPGVYDSNLSKIDHKGNVEINGYFQSFKYFESTSKLVRSELKFKEDILSKADDYLRTFKKDGRVFIGIHVRRSDMNTRHELKRGYNVAPASYFRKAMSHFRKKYPSSVFIVCSDDVRWCQAEITGPDVHYSPTKSATVDLAILSRCNHSIVSTGTFGWWGAWLAGGETTYYENFPLNGSWLASVYNRNDYYPPSWTPML